MGGEESTEQESVGNKSYFGEVGNLGHIDEQNIETSIRDLQLERLYKRAPHLRPQPPKPKPKHVHLKTLISIKIEEAKIKKIDNMYLAIIPMMSEAPGFILISSDSIVNSQTFQKSTDYTIISIPLPKVDSFTLEIAPFVEQYTEPLAHGFQIVDKHSLNFEILKDGENVRFKLQNQVLNSGQNVITIKSDKEIPCTEDLISTGECCMCSTSHADKALFSCGHNIICAKCANESNPRLHHCPYCGCVENM